MIGSWTGLMVWKTVKRFIEECTQVLEAISIAVPRGFICSAKDLKHFFTRLFLISYRADLPESDDILRVNYKSSTLSPCHICLSPKRGVKTLRRKDYELSILHCFLLRCSMMIMKQMQKNVKILQSNPRLQCFQICSGANKYLRGSICNFEVWTNACIVLLALPIRLKSVS